MSTAVHWFVYSDWVGKRVEVCWTNCCADAGHASAPATAMAIAAVADADAAWRHQTRKPRQAWLIWDASGGKVDGHHSRACNRRILYTV
jgi:hypothetical protein